MYKLLTTLTLAAALAVGVPFASAQNEGAEQLFAQLDTNQDGVLSEAEFTAHADLTADMFETYDKDGDGSVSRTEFIEAYGK